jgi:hypothetical protein
VLLLENGSGACPDDAQTVAFAEDIGQHPNNQWPDEPSFLVFGLNLEEAKKLGKSVRQDAIVWSDSDALPQLILLR